MSQIYNIWQGVYIAQLIKIILAFVFIYINNLFILKLFFFCLV